MDGDKDSIDTPASLEELSGRQTLTRDSCIFIFFAQRVPVVS